MRAFITDCHWEFIERPNVEIKKHCERLNQYETVFNCGDISTAKDLKRTLLTYDKHLEVPMYFVLGNHDFYLGSHYKVIEICRQLQLINVKYGPNYVVLGEDVEVFLNGFADGNGAYTNSLVNDENYISEFQGKTWYFQQTLRAQFALESLQHLQYQLQGFDFSSIKRLTIFTHVPPYKEACLYNGKQSKPEFLPFFCNTVLGGWIDTLSLNNPELKIRVFCGHTHGKCKYVRGNIEVNVGEAQYGKQFIQEME